MPRPAVQYVVSEWGFESAIVHDDPFSIMEVDVVFRHESGQTLTVPAYHAGDTAWRVRFSPPWPGHYAYHTVCTDPANVGLHGQTGELRAVAYTGTNPVLAHGALTVAANGRHFAFADGTPFFWLGDTWWMALTDRLGWPEEFQQAAADRVRKGFSVVQLVAGFFPDMPIGDPRGQNEGGHAWQPDLSRMNPAWFDQADLRVAWLVKNGIVPCIFGSWGFHLPMIGAERMRRHWRNLIARWSAYPVVWSLAGELAMPYYLDAKFGTGDDPELAAAWVSIGAYIRQTDPYQRLLTAHPTSNNTGRDQLTDDQILDFEMLQPGHDGYDSISKGLRWLAQSRARTPLMPVLIDELNYEEQGINSHAEAQRIGFWSAILNGSAGFTCGAGGLWSFNAPGRIWGASPHGTNWGDALWQDALQYAGAAQIALAKRLLERFEWWRIEPHPEWVSPSASPDDLFAPFAGGIPGELRLIYSVKPSFPWGQGRKYLLKLEEDVRYRVSWWNPRSGEAQPLAAPQPAADGTWLMPLEPTLQDWVLILEKSDTP
ncbi:MAG: DUF4038 domain-containing protein [Anaerolineae bacterium]|nr:DUF4038 domain-containing protein [Anaerolineae bacterium]